MYVHCSVVTFDTPSVLLDCTLESVVANFAGLQPDAAMLTLCNNAPHRLHAEGWSSLVARADWPCRTQHFADNPGYGTANNRVLLRSAADYYLILNPDAELEPGALKAALAYMDDHPDVVMVAPRVVNDAGEREFLCKQNPGVLTFLLRGFAPPALQQRFRDRLDAFEMRSETADGVSEVDIPIASGCCLLVRGEAFRQVGGFDERYFLYFEDFDLCMRIRRLGRIVYLDRMNVTHHGGRAARKGWWHILQFMRSGVRFFASHGWRW